jgi:GNAT superfamily N-acetyltransferase
VPDDSEQTVRLALDVAAERATDRLRLTAAAIAAAAGLWLLALPYAVPRAIAIAGLLFATLWTARSLRRGADAEDPAEHYLELSPAALSLRAGSLIDRVPWPEVAGVAVDEDRLLLRVVRRHGPPLEIEPRYRGLGLHALYEAVADAWRKAGAERGCAPAGDG